MVSNMTLNLVPQVGKQMLPKCVAASLTKLAIQLRCCLLRMQRIDLVLEGKGGCLLSSYNVKTVFFYQEFNRKGGSKTVDQHKLPVSVSARHIRFHPTRRNKWNCLRVEIYGVASKTAKSTRIFVLLKLLIFYRYVYFSDETVDERVARVCSHRQLCQESRKKCKIQAARLDWVLHETLKPRRYRNHQYFRWTFIW